MGRVGMLDWWALSLCAVIKAYDAGWFMDGFGLVGVWVLQVSMNFSAMISLSPTMVSSRFSIFCFWFSTVFFEVFVIFRQFYIFETISFLVDILVKVNNR